MKKIFSLTAIFIIALQALASAQEQDCDADVDSLFISARPLAKGLLDEHGFGLALLIGINDYNSSDLILPKLKAPSCEIRQLEAILKDNDYVVKTLSDAQATRQNIKRWITCFGKRAHLGDRLLFYFAGHGGKLDSSLARWMDYKTKDKYWTKILRALKTDTTELALCLYQPQPNSLSEIVLIEEITEWIAASSAHQQIIWIDACYSGNMNKIFQLPLQFYTYRLPNDGFFAITGIKDRVFDGQYGRQMLRGLRGAADDTLAGNRDGRISLYEVSTFIDHNLRKKTVDSTGVVFKSRYILVGSGQLFLVNARKKG
jgi:hypothetical protein